MFLGLSPQHSWFTPDAKISHLLIQTGYFQQNVIFTALVKHLASNPFD